MRRYLLFTGDNCYPLGGWRDFKGSFNHIDIALEHARKHEQSEERRGSNYRWAHVVDSETGEYIYGDPE